MERPWPADAWRPTIYRTNPAQTPPTPPQPAAYHTEHVQRLTRTLLTSAYDPCIWTARADHLLALAYPELAASDAYKAILLCDYSHGLIPPPSGTAPHRDKPEPAESTGRHLKHAYRTLVQALYDCHCHPEALHICREAASRLPDDPYFQMKTADLSAVMDRKYQHVAASGETQVLQRDMLYDGAVLTIPYPWMQPRHLQRPQVLIDSVNKEFKRSFRSCRLGYSSIGPSSSPTFAGHAPQALGVFATREIDPGECILVDPTATGASSSAAGCVNCFRKVTDVKVEATCCSTIYCSEDCYQLALSTYHGANCGKDFAWLQTAVEGISESAAAMRPLLLFRYLSACVQAGTELHPLDHPLIARLQPQMSGRHLDVFTLSESVVAPIRILQQLGVDVFANSNFDTWVIHTIWTRLANNKQGFPRKPENGGGWIDSISPLMPFFNHSCEPNVECWHDDTTTVRFFARRRIEEGEELFDSYVNVECILHEERQRILWPWFEGPCLCSKCSRESSSRHGPSQRYVTTTARP